MAINRPINPNNLPWFPFYAAAWTGSRTVVKMSMAERGIYISLLAVCWQHGELEWDADYLSRILCGDKRTIQKWMDKYECLVETSSSLENSGAFQQISGEMQQFSGELADSHENSRTFRRIVLPKLQDFSSTMRKNVVSAGQSRVEQITEEGDDADDVNGQAATLPTHLPSPYGETGKNKPVKPSVPVGTNRKVHPARVGKNSPASVAPSVPAKEQARAPANAGNTPGLQLNDIREWPDSEDRFGISGTRIRDCIIYQLDAMKSPWYSDKAFPTISKLNSAGYVTKLDADTPAGWTPQTAHAEEHVKKNELNKYPTRDVVFD